MKQWCPGSEQVFGVVNVLDLKLLDRDFVQVIKMASNRSLTITWYKVFVPNLEIPPFPSFPAIWEHYEAVRRGGNLKPEHFYFLDIICFFKILINWELNYY